MIGFIGLGKMGAAMGANLLRKGYKVMIYARQSQQASPLIALGAQRADGPASLAAACDMVFTIIGGPSDVKDVYFGPRGLLENATVGSALVDMTTSSPALARDIADAGQKRGIDILDAPVTGGVKGAEDGRLSFMIGGEAMVIDRVRPVFEVMGSKLFHVGPAGSGQAMKACNQIAVAGILLGAAEAMAMAARQGITPALAFQVLSSGTAASPLFTALWDRAQMDEIGTGFSVAQFAKDLRIAASAARHGHENTLALLALEIFERLETEGKGQNGLQSLLVPL